MCKMEQVASQQLNYHNRRRRYLMLKHLRPMDQTCQMGIWLTYACDRTGFWPSNRKAVNWSDTRRIPVSTLHDELNNRLYSAGIWQVIAFFSVIVNPIAGSSLLW